MAASAAARPTIRRTDARASDTSASADGTETPLVNVAQPPAAPRSRGPCRRPGASPPGELTPRESAGPIGGATPGRARPGDGMNALAEWRTLDRGQRSAFIASFLGWT